ncbi:dsDNA nuclease domain-containing protein [Deinococcus roseus]|uniref:CD-NTase associated protein 4-like DNA endonuclease domain-containing protein n=1 Tax=Deinococcus roseus TaxID=392414 RepID=A0ABQ2DF77_9DEIO|nr:dsDNA nuclease domain-containing protein [Deinococcus roseus]GGJ55916.1 hypothetical protein GCM10008938_47600 [Deinococcus roseus]
MESSSPLFDHLDHNDPGDSTLNRYRYQHAYGVILALASVRKTAVGFQSIYCEHHEDLLGVTPDLKVHAFQVKTTNGDKWQTTTPAFCHAIARFIELHRKYGEQVARFHFVSNQDFSRVGRDAQSNRDKAKSPTLLLDICKDTTLEAYPEYFLDACDRLTDHCHCTMEELLSVLKRTVLVLGPSLNGFMHELVAEHLPKTLGTTEMSIESASQTCRELLELFTVASGLPSDPDARVLPVEQTKSGTTTVEAKRICLEQVQGVLGRRLQRSRLGALPDDPTLETLEQSKGAKRLIKKLQRGGLDAQVRTMQRRKTTAFDFFMRWQHRNPVEAEQALQAVQAEVERCHADHHVRISSEHEVFGRKLFAAMDKEFERMIINQPHMIYNVGYDILFGVTAMRTEDCILWWSEPFDLEEAT